MALALYRKYRPSTFAEVVGQEHVTEPLQQALRNDQVHPRLLILRAARLRHETVDPHLARSKAELCEGPTPDPCGVSCDSCISLAPNGRQPRRRRDRRHQTTAASTCHRLRERAFLRARVVAFKIYIIDEAHMVTASPSTRC